MDELSPRPYEGIGDIDDPKMGTVTETKGYQWYDVAVSGDEAMYQEDVFATYRFEIRRDGEVRIRSEEALIGIGYEYEVGITPSEIYITRGEAIDPSIESRTQVSIQRSVFDGAW